MSYVSLCCAQFSNIVVRGGRVDENDGWWEHDIVQVSTLLSDRGTSF